ncbi:ribonuclease P protein component [Fulvivirga imtechensis]|nr:ribonuclease P protein component [Fulvivirga imtechensis]
MTFKKSERLCSKKAIQELFSKGSSFYIYPFKIISRADPKGSFHQILISVPKRNFKKAVLRNKFKRRIREAYRLNKHLLKSTSKLQIAYIYTAKELLEYKEIERKLILALERLNQQLAKGE